MTRPLVTLSEHVQLAAVVRQLDHALRSGVIAQLARCSGREAFAVHGARKAVDWLRRVLCDRATKVHGADVARLYRDALRIHPLLAVRRSRARLRIVTTTTTEKTPCSNS